MNSLPIQPPGNERTASWWAEPGTRADFDKRAAEQVPRMAASQEGHRLRPWTSNVGPQPEIRSATTEADVECVARA